MSYATLLCGGIVPLHRVAALCRCAALQDNGADGPAGARSGAECGVRARWTYTQPQKAQKAQVVPHGAAMQLRAVRMQCRPCGALSNAAAQQSWMSSEVRVTPCRLR